MQKEIFEILDLCDRTNKLNGLDVSFGYHGHVDGLDVTIKTSNKKLQIDEFRHLYTSETIYIVPDKFRSKTEITKALKKLKSDLKKILEEHSVSQGLLEFMEETA